MSLRFDQTGWQPLQPGAFRNADGDTVALHGFDLPPDLPAPWSSSTTCAAAPPPRPPNPAAD